MPTFKHPCPHCGKYIARDVASCPYCATADPFAPVRCPNCRTVIEDLAWTSCPSCGQALMKPAAAQVPTSAAPTGPTSAQAGGKCTGCGAPLAPGARFCTVCGTLAA